MGLNMSQKNNPEMLWSLQVGIILQDRLLKNVVCDYFADTFGINVFAFAKCVNWHFPGDRAA